MTRVTRLRNRRFTWGCEARGATCKCTCGTEPRKSLFNRRHLEHSSWQHPALKFTANNKRTRWNLTVSVKTDSCLCILTVSEPAVSKGYKRLLLNKRSSINLRLGEHEWSSEFTFLITGKQGCWGFFSATCISTRQGGCVFGFFPPNFLINWIFFFL